MAFTRSKNGYIDREVDLNAESLNTIVYGVYVMSEWPIYAPWSTFKHWMTDECTAAGACGDGRSCTNTIGSFFCACEAGTRYNFTTDHCVDIDECENASTCHHTCVNTFGGYECSCRTGFTLFHDQRTCTDINECNTDHNQCDHFCENLYGSYKARGEYILVLKLLLK